MKSLVRYFIDRPLVVNLISFLIVIAGILTIFNLQKETFPRVQFDVILVSTSYPGSSSEDVEKLVTIPIERELKKVTGIKDLNALSAEGRSIIYLEIDPDQDLEVVLRDVQNGIDTVTDLPEDAKIPQVRSLDNKRRGVLKIALTGDDFEVVRETSKDLRDKLEQLREVGFIELDGHYTDEIAIKVNPHSLKKYELSFAHIAMALTSKNLSLSAGNIKDPSGNINIRTVGEFSTVEDVKNLVISSNFTGQKIYLKDVAQVSKGEPEDSIIDRAKGKRAVFVDIKIKENADVLKSTDKIKNTTEEFFKKNDNLKVDYSYVDDASFFVNRRLSILRGNGLMGMVLVFICLLLFLDFKTSLMTSFGAPIAFMAAFIVMDLMGVSLNLISMFALILVLGMLVDDSIIVAEHFYQKIEMGVPARIAAYESAIETVKPVTATILTTMIAFGALFFMGGIMGKFLWSVPMVVIICLAASWLECFFILPSHLSEVCTGRPKHGGDRWYGPLLKFYKKTLEVVLRIPYLTVGTFLVLFIASLFIAKNMRFELFPGDDVTTVFLQVKGKVGAQLSDTNRAVEKLEKIVMELPSTELEQVKGVVGMLYGEHGNKTGTHYGSLSLYLTSPDLRKRSTDEIIADVTEKAKSVVTNYKVIVQKVQGGPPKGKPVEIDLEGDNLDDLKRASKDVEQMLAKGIGVQSTEIDFEVGKEQVVVTINDAEARRLGVTTKDAAIEIRRAFAHDEVTQIRESDEDIKIKMSLDEKYRGSVDSLQLMSVMNNQGKSIPLVNFAKFEKKPGAFVIRRKNRKRIISVSASLDKNLTTPVKISKEMEKPLEEVMKAYPKIRYSFGGENKDTNESIGRLGRSGIIAIMTIFFILVAMFSSFGQPIVIMSAIPLGMIGVVLSFKLYGLTLGFMALMGVVALAGVVVNDSIVLVSFINVLRENSNRPVINDIIEGCLSRLRPVLLTTFTTVAGLLPVAHSPGGDPFLKPMAISFAYGLAFATLVTLIFVPTSYLIYDKIYCFFKRKFLGSHLKSEEFSNTSQSI